MEELEKHHPKVEFRLGRVMAPLMKQKQAGEGAPEGSGKAAFWA